MSIGHCKALHNTANIPCSFLTGSTVSVLYRQALLASDPMVPIASKPQTLPPSAVKCDQALQA